MSFVQTNFPLPSVTGKSGAVMAIPFAPGRCRVDVKSGIRGKQQSRVIRPIVQRTKLSVVLPVANRSLGEVAGFWDSLVKGVTGAVKGFAVGGPAGAIAGGAGGAIAGSTGKGKGAAQPQVVPQQQLGPLAGVSTGTIVGVGLGFSALILVLASRGR
jgi:hypothetical protein